MDIGQTSTRVEDRKDSKEKHAKLMDKSTQLHTQLKELASKSSKLQDAYLVLEQGQILEFAVKASYDQKAVKKKALSWDTSVRDYMEDSE
ncbi:hypothetical protein R1sor_010709 [Riccia sorocarpa]|uniref:Uncharacterized protein n=1 Tax=Riccia sorocarpa TaxID=122646 RepID=A0ABD3HYV0_9MARC